MMTDTKKWHNFTQISILASCLFSNTQVKSNLWLKTKTGSYIVFSVARTLIPEP